MSVQSSKIQTRVKLRNLPERFRNLVPRNAETAHKLRFLEINGRVPALEGLHEFLLKDSKDVYKMVKNLKLQLVSKATVRDRKKIETGKRPNQKGIIEIKATRGHSRLFAFFSSDRSLIICTHTYWKTSDNTKQQNREFDKAAGMRELYIAATTKKGSN
mgnify:FL=1